MPELNGALLGKLPELATVTKLSPAKQRIVDAAVAIGASAPSIAYQHTVLCQTCLPYRDPGDAIREWERDNGKVMLSLEAGKAMHPKDGLIRVGLPFGPKPRLVLYYLNTQAIIHQKPEIDVEDSLTAFVKRVGLASHGRNIRTIKDQLGRLSATRITLGIVKSETEATTVNTQIISKFDLWFPKDDRQRVLWPTAIVFSREYFESLVNHAVPLDERALAALSDSAMALDIYAWLSQRLHRIDPRRSDFIPWPAVQRQFGQGFARLRKFRETFLGALRQVQAVYPAAKVQASARGLSLHHSAPPVPYRIARRLAGQ
jgi:Plasmid encoded RepA protein